MTEFYLRTERGQPIPSPPTVVLDWFPGGNGRGSTIDVLQSLNPVSAPTGTAWDFLRFSAAVYCADRLTVRPGTWTRSISLGFPVADIAAWRGAAGGLADALEFLTGDEWRLEPRPSGEPLAQAPSSESVDAVCLFSGGLDSFAGAVDLMAAGSTVSLVAHYEGGQSPTAQVRLAEQLGLRYPAHPIALRRIFLRPAASSEEQERPLPEGRESSTRSRSLLFIAAGLVVASQSGPEVPLFIPENGYIGINVPLTRARSGSLSTRTTHPYFMASLSACLARLRITNRLVNPFRLMTKGETVAASSDPHAMRSLARTTLSCAHPEASRYARRRQGNCGYCFPCLIRRAALYHVGLDDSADYAFDALRENEALAGARGSDLRALVRAMSTPGRAIDVLRNGPVPSEDVRAFADVYERGRREILGWMEAVSASAPVEK